MKLKSFIVISLLLISLISAYANGQEEPEETNEEYCESIYWEDKDNCLDWHDENLEINEEICRSVIFESTRKTCFKVLEEREKEKLKK